MRFKLHHIKADGTETHSEQDHEPTLEQLQEAVGGYIERWTFELAKGSKSERVIYWDEDGRLKGLPVNTKASDMVNTEIVGDVVIVYRA